MPKIILIKDSQRPSMPALQSSPEGLAGLNKRWPGRYYEVGGSVEQVVIKKKADVEPVGAVDNTLGTPIKSEVSKEEWQEVLDKAEEQQEKPKKKRYKKKK